ncbi:MAG: hypothetical protein WD114_03830, partial [Phycisphaerales bacterium]
MDPLDQFRSTSRGPGQPKGNETGPTVPPARALGSLGGKGHAQTGYGHGPGPIETRSESYPIARAQIRRDVFWQNVCREILMALASTAAESSGRLGTGPSAAESSTSPVDELFDGRMGVITTLGQRIPIADVTTVFSCSVNGSEADRSLSNDIQCTVFRITTPTGETYTLPLSQIAGVHTLSPSLLEQIEDRRNDRDEGKDQVPFGFAAYTSTARSERLGRGDQRGGGDGPREG